MLEKSIPKLFSVILFLVACVAQATAQGIPPGASSTDTGFGGGNTIGGTVLTPTGQRAERRMSVRLQTMTKGDRVTTTDEYGNFVFRGLPSGEYTIVIDKEKDFEPFVQPVSIIQPRGMPPQTYNLSLRLTLKRGTTTRPSVINAEFANVPKRALDMFNKALELAKTGETSEAIHQLRSAIAEYPEFMLAYNEIGVLYMKSNELRKADESLQAAIKLEPQAFMPKMNRGIVLFMQKRYAEAETLLREVIKVKQDLAVGHYFLGQAIANLGNFDEAETELLKAIELGGDEMKEAHRLLAIIYSSRGDKKNAISQLETYLKLAPTTPDAEQLRNVIKKLKSEDSTSLQQKP